MSNGDGERLYRVKIKEGSHINEKVKEDGSRAAIQFDKENALQGPVDLVEVDEDEYTKEVFIETERSFEEIILEDVVAPVAVEVLVDIMERVIDAGIDALFTKVIPATKIKCGEFIDKAKSLHIERKTKKHTEIQSALQRETIEQQSVYHSQEEVDQLANNMMFAALYIAAGIRELSNTVITKSEDPKKALEIETKLKELSSEQVMNTINFMLEEHNRDKIDQVTLQLFEAFRNRNFIVDGKIVPIKNYLANEETKII